LAALPFAWFLWLLPRAWAWGIAAVVFFLGVWAARSVIRRTGVHDHQSIVIDEVCGIFLVTSIAPHSWAWYGAAFVLFRIFDIWKPWPVRWVDRKWKGGGGAMMDDIVAAMLAAAVLFALLAFQASWPISLLL
jgi:phosphatidylglycerophosphatase A